MQLEQAAPDPASESVIVQLHELSFSCGMGASSAYDTASFAAASIAYAVFVVSAIHIIAVVFYERQDAQAAGHRSDRQQPPGALLDMSRKHADVQSSASRAPGSGELGSRDAVVSYHSCWPFQLPSLEVCQSGGASRRAP
jgi:hypothetical protein